MSISVPKSILVLAFIFAIWWLTRQSGPPDDPTRGASAPTATEGLDRSMNARLELAVMSAANAAECGYSEIGLGYREPEEAAGHLVALMRSASGEPLDVPNAGEPMVGYVLDNPERPWQVAIHLDENGPALMIEGFGPDLRDPLFTQRVPCS